MRMTGARGAMKSRQETRSLRGFGKMWNSGDKLTVYYPLTTLEDGSLDIMVTDVWGHDINPKETSLKRIFIPSNANIVNGKPEKADVLYQFSRISKLFQEGEYQRKVKSLKARLNIESQLKASLEKAEKDYEEAVDSTAVGVLRNVISTECVACKLDSNGRPDTKEFCSLVSQDLSDSRISALIKILDDPQFYVPPDAKYLEVTYAFGVTGKRKEDGKVDPMGVTTDYTIERRFPEEFKEIQRLIDRLPESSDTIQKRNNSYTPVDEAVIITALSTYSAINIEGLDGISEDDEALKRLANQSELIELLNIPLNFELPTSPSEIPTMQKLISEEDIISARLKEEETSIDSAVGEGTSTLDTTGEENSFGALGNLISE